MKCTKEIVIKMKSLMNAVAKMRAVVQVAIENEICDVATKMKEWK